MPSTPLNHPGGRIARLTCWAGPAARGMALAGVSLAMVGAVQAAEVSVSKPVGQLFAPAASQLSPAGERWLRLQVASDARQADHRVVVQIPGATPQLQQQRAAVIRQRLTGLGIAPQHIYMEAAPAEPAPSRLAAL